MTVATASNRSDYTGNAVATSFAYPGKIFAATDLQVYVAGVLQVLNTDYTVTNVNSIDGGNVVFTTAPADLAAIVILRIVDETQATSLRNQGAYYADSIEDALDRRAMVDIQLQDQLDGAIKQPITEDRLDMSLPILTTRASKFLAFDAEGKPVEASGTGADAGLRTDLGSTLTPGATLIGLDSPDYPTVKSFLDSTVTQNDFSEDNYSLNSKLLKGIVSFMFDSTDTSIFNTAFLNVFQPAGIPCGLALNSFYMFAPGYTVGSKITSAELNEIISYGWEILNHGTGRAPVTALDLQAGIRDIQNAYRLFREYGIEIKGYLPINGTYDAKFAPTIKMYHDYAFNGDPAMPASGAQATNAAGKDPYTFVRAGMDVALLADLEALIDYAAANKTWVCFYGHGAGPGFLSQADLASLLAYAQAQSGVDILLPSQAAARFSNNVVRGVGIQRVNLDAGEGYARNPINMLVNPGFEAKTTGNFVPAAWTWVDGTLTGTVTKSTNKRSPSNTFQVQFDGTNTGSSESGNLYQSISFDPIIEGIPFAFAVSAILPTGSNVGIQLAYTCYNGGVVVSSETTKEVLLDSFPNEIVLSGNIPGSSSVDSVTFSIVVNQKAAANAAIFRVSKPRLVFGGVPASFSLTPAILRDTAKVVLVGAFNIPTGVKTVVKFDNVSFDTFGSYDTSTGLFTVLKSGKYRINGRLTVTTCVDAIAMYAIIQRNGTDAASERVVSKGTSQQTVSVSDILSLAAGDTIGIAMLQSSGGNYAISATPYSSASIEYSEP